MYYFSTSSARRLSGRYIVLLFLLVLTFFGIQHPSQAGFVTINGVTLNISGTGSAYIASNHSTTNDLSKCSSNSASSTAYFVGSQLSPSGTVTFSAYTPLTLLDVYFTNVGTTEKFSVTPPAGVTVTAICGLVKNGDGTYSGSSDTFSSWQHLRFTSTEANAFSSIVLNAGTATSWAYYIPVNGVTPICIAPQITSQPFPENIVCEIGAYTLYTNASGNNLVFDWQYSTDDGANWIAASTDPVQFSGFSTRVLTVNAASNVGHLGRLYRAVASNGCGTATSNVTEVTQVGTFPVITVQPPASQSVCSGNTYTWSVTASGEGLSYNWQFSENEGGTWFNAAQAGGPNILNGNRATMTVRGFDVSLTSKRLYRVQVSNGICSIFSEPGRVIVNAAPTEPTLSAATASNTCPAETINLNTFLSSTAPWGSSVEWLLNNVLVTDPSASKTAGTYYARHSDSRFVGTCYSRNSPALAVTILNCAELPVNLVSFEGKSAGAANLLSWTTAGEENNKEFEVESSADAIHFVKIGTVAGNGTVSAGKVYHFTDTAPLAEKVYYRLKQIDHDGQSELSRIILVRGEIVAPHFAAYPNPAGNDLWLKAGDGQKISESTLYSLNGTLYTQQKGSLNKLDLSGLKSGIYILKVRMENGKTSQQLIFRN